MRKKDKLEQKVIEEQVVFVGSSEESLTLSSVVGLCLIASIMAYLLVPQVRLLVNTTLTGLLAEVSNEGEKENKGEEEPISPLPESKKVISVSNTVVRSETRPTSKTVSASVLFLDDTSIGARFIGMAEGNYKINNSGSYYNTKLFYGHLEPSKAVPDNTINRGFCSTTGSHKDGVSNAEKVYSANRKCMNIARKLSKEVMKALNIGPNDKLSEPMLSLVLTSIDLGNQARSEVRKNMYSIQIPKALESGKQITLLDITRMRRDSFYSSSKNRLDSALDTIKGLVSKSKRYCGNSLEPNVIAVDQVRRTVEANEALTKVGMGLPPMTEKEILDQLCIKK